MSKKTAHNLERDVTGATVKVTYTHVDDHLVEITSYRRRKIGGDNFVRVKHMEGKVMPLWQLTGKSSQ